MTEKEKLEAIIAEIERFRKTNKVSEDKEYAQYELDVKCGYDIALDDMLSYINSLFEETVSEDLEQAAEEYEEKGRIDAFVSRKRDFINGAQWQKIQMMKDAIDGYVIEDIEEGNGDFLLSAEYLPKSMGLKDQQRVKVIVIRED